MGWADLQAHLDTGATTLARAWAVDRPDGVAFGFTDHDRDLAFEGRVFRADTGVTARALEQTTGLAVDNSEALGALSDAGVTEADILAGRFDGAEVRAWLVNWANVAERVLIFRGTMGEIRRGAGAFEAELRGLSEPLNRDQGRVYQKPCSAALGDGACGIDLNDPAWHEVATVMAAMDGRILTLPALPRGAGWAERGRLRVTSGAGARLIGLVKADRVTATGRVVELWEALPGIAAGDAVRLEAGCDKRAETCRAKFANLLNHRGFPHIPGEDWLVATPTRQVRG